MTLLGPLVDTHAHLDSPRLDGVRGAVLTRAAASGVTHALIPAVEPGTFDALWAVAQAPSPLVLHVGWGIHRQMLPNVPPSWDAPALAAVRRACVDRPPCAIGECGLDYRVDLDAAPRDRQRAVLREHLGLARELRLPLLLHCLSAFDDLAEDLRSGGPLPGGGIMHSYSGSAEQLVPFLRLGLHISFAGPVTWANARKAPVAARAVPRDRLLCETDTPDQAPHPHRGTLNEPAHLVHVVQALAEARGEDPVDTAALCTQNATTLLRLG